MNKRHVNRKIPVWYYTLPYLQGAGVHLGTGDGQAQPGPQLLPGGGDGGAGGLCCHAGILAPSPLQGRP